MHAAPGAFSRGLDEFPSSFVVLLAAMIGAHLAPKKAVRPPALARPFIGQLSAPPPQVERRMPLVGPRRSCGPDAGGVANEAARTPLSRM